MDQQFRTRYELPRMIVLGRDLTLPFPVYNDRGRELLPSSITFRLMAGSTELVPETAATAGTPSSFPLLGSVTSSLQPRADLHEYWTVTHAGITEELDREAYLVLRALRPVITDDDLTTGRHSELRSLLSRKLSTFKGYRWEGWVWVNQQLIRWGRRPDLILNNSALREPHICKTLEFIFRDWALELSADGRYDKEEEKYRACADSQMEQLMLDYDADQDGVTDGTVTAAQPTIHTAAPPPCW